MSDLKTHKVFGGIILIIQATGLIPTFSNQLAGFGWALLSCWVMWHPSLVWDGLYSRKMAQPPGGFFGEINREEARSEDDAGGTAQAKATGLSWQAFWRRGLYVFALVCPKPSKEKAFFNPPVGPSFLDPNALSNASPHIRADPAAHLTPVLLPATGAQGRVPGALSHG